MALRRFLMLIAALTLVSLVAAAWFLPNSEDFRIENGSWNGLSQLYTASSFQSLTSTDELPPSPEGTTLVLIPYLDYSTTELEKIREYVSRGGNIFLADDYGYGNRLLAYLGMEARFSGQNLLDPLINYRNENFPRIVHLGSDPLTDGTESLVFNHATSLLHVDSDDAIALSSPFSFLDSNDNGNKDTGEPAGPLPVISRHQLGNSQVVLVTDPSIFINGMESLGDNARFIQNISATSTLLLIDQSHLETSELGRTQGWLKAVRRFLAGTTGTVFIITVAVFAALLPVWYRRKETNGVTLFQKYLSNILERR